MEDRNNNSVRVVNHDTVFELVIPLLTDSRDRDAVSLVSKRWYEIDSLTRKHVTIALCYAATPRLLTKRFPQLESLKLKGKPRASMFNLIPDNWGGYASPWIEEITRVYTKLKSLHFRRMIVTDADLELLASSKGSILESKGNILEVLKLDKCSGFSTDGLLHITRSCSNLRTLFLEENGIVDNDGEWLHELSSSNRVLENLNFYMTDLGKVRFNDLEVIASKCPLVSVKVSDCDLLELVGFFRAATGLEEFAGGSVITQQELLGEDGVNEQLERYAPVLFPPKLHHLGVTYLGNAEMPLLYPVAARLKKLDLLYAFLDTEGHCALLAKCPNLEILEARNVIGDRGLEVVARCCTKLKRLRIERGDDDEQGMEDEEGTVSQRGLIALAQGCSRLEYVAIYVSDITNEALESIGTYSKNMCDFRLVLLEREEKITDLPLDNGVLALLTGCLKLKRFALYLRQGGLTDVGLGYIGQFSQNIRWMLLGFVGESDNGLIAFSRGCPSLQKLELRGCCFSERAIAMAVRNLNSLRYLWVQGYVASGDGQDLLAMARPFWNIELIPPRRVVSYGPNGETIHDEHPAHILAYYSLAGHRTDFPETVVPLILSWSGQN